MFQLEEQLQSPSALYIRREMASVGCAKTHPRRAQSRRENMGRVEQVFESETTFENYGINLRFTIYERRKSFEL